MTDARGPKLKKLHVLSSSRTSVICYRPAETGDRLLALVDSLQLDDLEFTSARREFKNGSIADSLPHQ